MLYHIIQSGPMIDEGLLTSFEARYHLKLPKAYRDFMLKNNGGQPVPAAFPIEGFSNNPIGVIQAFFGLNVEIPTEDIDIIMAELVEHIPMGILPIGCTEGDDFICMDLRKATEGHIVFWDRKPFWGNSIWNENDLYRVTDNFASLLTALHDS